ncbi:hypothetical protein AM228_16300 [Planktothricoides sp. SR001]|nr:hypothetical protein AM228_16300 [Planktothricoides sp. SR001]
MYNPLIFVRINIPEIYLKPGFPCQKISQIINISGNRRFFYLQLVEYSREFCLPAMGFDTEHIREYCVIFISVKSWLVYF